jgi:DNA-3-methyladenine glycosylase
VIVGLESDFYDRSVHDVARDLLGAVVSHAGVSVRLTEVEAYAGVGDPGSHAFRGMTPRTEVLFAEPGSLYVYFTYGMHWCANLVAGPCGSGAAVLLRAGEVVDGAETALKRRQGSRGGRILPRDVARGPARLTVAMSLGKAHNGLLVTALDCPIQVDRGAPISDALVRRGPRVGVSGPGGDATAYPWRLWVDGDPTVSTYRPGVVRSRSRTSS